MSVEGENIHHIVTGCGLHRESRTRGMDPPENGHCSGPTEALALQGSQRSCLWLCEAGEMGEIGGGEREGRSGKGEAGVRPGAAEGVKVAAKPAGSNCWG